MEFRQLTKAEEEIMHYFWNLGQCTVSDIINERAEPKPPHSSYSNLVSFIAKEKELSVTELNELYRLLEDK